MEPKIVTPQLKTPTWADLQKMATEIKKVLGKPMEKLSWEAYYPLIFLSNIEVDDKADKTPIF